MDINSAQFQEELKNTVQFTDDVIAKYSLNYNPDSEVNRHIQMGLTRNQLIYGKRYCPCFFVTNNDEENRLCPCKPALSNEIPTKGSCHCGIFCSSDYQKQELIDEPQKTVSKEYNEILEKDYIDADELERLLNARNEGKIDFLLVDTREVIEYKNARIDGTDHLIPTTSFYHSIKQLDEKKDIPIVVYCHSGSRSDYCMRLMKKMGFKSVSNLDYGIMSYKGNIQRG